MLDWLGERNGDTDATTAGRRIESGDLVLDIHRFKEIDYMTVHLWILNWSWYDPLDAEATYPEAERQAVEYLDQHIAFAEQLGKRFLAVF